MADLAPSWKEFAVTGTDPNKHTSKPGIAKARNTPSSHSATAPDQTVIKVPFAKSPLVQKFDQVVRLGAETMPNGLCPSETYLG